MNLLSHLFHSLAAAIELYGPRLGEAALLMAGYTAAALLLRRALRRAAGSADDRGTALTLLGETARIALLIVGIISSLGVLGVDVTALMAGLGLTGFALGFALRDILSNVLSGVLILIYRPFRRGEHIIVSGMEGRVQAVDLRYTTLAASSGRILIPNATLFTQSVTVLNPNQTPAADTGADA